MKRIFIYTEEYEKQLKRLKIDLSRQKVIENEILNDPAVGSLIKSSGGLRKIRIAGLGSGKSGGLRVLYVDFPSYEKIYFITIIDKREIDNLSPKEINSIKVLIKSLKDETTKK